ncbi:amino acid adenylation domain-containing protein, partial [Bacillus sp. PBIB7]
MERFIKESLLSKGQNDLFLHYRMHPTLSTYNERYAWHIHNSLNIPLVRQAFIEIINRHEIFRSVFTIDETKPIQKILLKPIIDFRVIDAQLWSESSIQRYIEQETEIPFVLEQEPPFRIRLVQISDHHYILLLIWHHIIFDGWTLSLVLDEFGKIYKSLLEKKDPDLQPLLFQYSDFVSWQNIWLNKNGKHSKEFWLQKLSSQIPLIEWPTSKKTFSTSYEGKLFPFKFNQNLTEQLKGFCEDYNFTLSTLLFSLYFAFLHRYTGQNEIVIGTPRFGRKNKDFLKTCGYFVNTLPIRMVYSRNENFLSFMSRIRQELNNCIMHQDYPFPLIREQLPNDYVGNYARVCQANFVFQRACEQQAAIFLGNCSNTFDLYGLTLQPFFIQKRISKFDLTLFIEQDNNGEIYGNFEYNTDIFDNKAIEDIVKYFEAFIYSILNQKNQMLSNINILPEFEKHLILNDFNDTKAEYPKDKTIHELFEQQVKSVPDQTALVFGNEQLTYQQLNERANQLARTLRNEGVGADQLVGIMAERSLDMIVGILGILKAGGAYVPIDPEYPEERIHYMLEDSKAHLLLTQSHLRDRISFAGKILSLDEEDSYDETGSNLKSIVEPHHLAYVIYTSGTTGKPKGVMVEHRGLCNLKTYFKENLHMNEHDRVVQFASISFDAAVWEIFSTLFMGGSLYVPNKEVVMDHLAFASYINQNKITTVTLPPSYAMYIEPEQVPCLKRLITAGSASTVALVEKWKNDVTYINAYGPTEDSICSTSLIYDVNTMDLNNIPIGRPIPNHNVYILNTSDQLQPVGVPGELCISGVGLARGYLNRPDLTAEKFVDHPFIPGEKLYRTGDLARWLPEGNIEYLGRIDHQVKIRGYRIEIGEIETALLNLEAVQEAIVVAHENNNGDKALCAYYVASESFAVSEMKEKLSVQMPSYMIPSYFIQLEKMPLTSNGKIDRKALPLPDEKSIQTGVEYIAPCTPTEQALVTAWESVLGVKRIGLLDNFYDLGGDSIKSIQVSSRLFQAGYKVEMKHLLKYPTIAQLSGYVECITSVAEQGEITGAAPLTPIQSWFFEENFVDHYFNQAMMLYRPDRFDIAILRKVIGQIVQHHDALRTVFVKQENEFTAWIRGIAEGELFTLDVFDLQEEQDCAQIVEARANQIQSSIKINEGPLIKLALFQCPDGDHLLIVIHHLVIDMVSWRILFEDIMSGYNQAMAGKVIQFAPKADSFKLWSEQLCEYANSTEIKEERTYWDEIEQTVQRLDPLPKDREQHSTLHESSGVMSIEWTVQETEQLLKHANQAYNTEINDLLLTALGMGVQRWTGRQEIVVNLEGHGREMIIPEVDITRTVGWFTSQYPVVLQIPEALDISEQIKAVKEGLRRIPHKGIGYGILRYLSNQDQISYTAKPEISFNYLGQFDQDLDSNALRMSSYSTGMAMSKQTERLHVLSMNGMIQNGKLFFMIDYSKEQYRDETIEQLGAWIKNSLQQVIQHCVSKEEGEITPSDLTLKGMSMEELAQIREETKQVGDIEDLYELTPMQKGMLFHNLADTNSAAYFEQMTFDVNGDLNVDVFIRSLESLMQRHTILRTNIYQGWRD